MVLQHGAERRLDVRRVELLLAERRRAPAPSRSSRRARAASAGRAAAARPRSGRPRRRAARGRRGRASSMISHSRSTDGWPIQWNRQRRLSASCSSRVRLDVRMTVGRRVATIVPSSGIVTWKSDSSSSRNASNSSSARSISSIRSTTGSSTSIASSSGRRIRKRRSNSSDSSTVALLRGPDVEQLPRVVPLVDGLAEIEPLVALEPDQARIERRGERLGGLGLPDARFALEQQRPLEPQRQEEGGREPAVGEVRGAGERRLELVDAGECHRVSVVDRRLEDRLDRGARRLPICVESPRGDCGRGADPRIGAMRPCRCSATGTASPSSAAGRSSCPSWRPGGCGSTARMLLAPEPSRRARGRGRRDPDRGDGVARPAGRGPRRPARPLCALDRRQRGARQRDGRRQHLRAARPRRPARRPRCGADRARRACPLDGRRRRADRAGGGLPRRRPLRAARARARGRPHRARRARYESPPPAGTLTRYAVATVAACLSERDGLRVGVAGAGPVAVRCRARRGEPGPGGRRWPTSEAVDDAVAPGSYREQVLPILVGRALREVGAAMRLTVNGSEHAIASAPLASLLHVLREELEVTSPKAGCQQGGCGSCTVLVDGEPRRACLIAVATVDGAEITTVEGLGEPDGALAGAGGVPRPLRRPVRLLHVRPRGRRHGADRREGRTARAGGGPRRALGPLLPLHRLRQDRRRRAGRVPRRGRRARGRQRRRPEGSSA